MRTPFDIFEVADDGKLLWKGAAEDFEVAKSNVRTLSIQRPADYVIYSQRTGNKTIIKNDGTIVERSADQRWS